MILHIERVCFVLNNIFTFDPVDPVETCSFNTVYITFQVVCRPVHGKATPVPSGICWDVGFKTSLQNLVGT